MPGRNSKNIPCNSDPGYLYGDHCKTIDGHLVLIDRKRTKLEIEADSQFIIIHIPTYMVMVGESRRKARTELEHLTLKGGPWIDEVAEKLEAQDKSNSKRRNACNTKIPKITAIPMVLAPTRTRDTTKT